MKNFTILFLVFLFLFQNSKLLALNTPAYKTFLRGTISLKKGNFDEAVKDYEKTISLDKNALPVYKDLLYIYWQLKKEEKSFKLAEKIDELDGKNSKTTSFLAQFYAFAKKNDTARIFWEKTLKLDPEDETAEACLAVYYQQDNKLKEAKKHWEHFLKTQPDNIAAYFQLALVQEKLNMTKAALNSYDKIIEMNPDLLDAYLAKARIYESEKRYDLVLLECQKYAKIYPDNPYAFLYLGKAYFTAGDMEKSEENFLKAKKEISDDNTAALWLGQIYENSGQTKKAIDEYQTVMLKEKTNPTVLTKLAYCNALLKKYSKAEKFFTKAASADSENSGIYYSMGLNYLDWKKYKKAAQCFNKTVELSPDFSDAYYFLGFAYDNLRNFKNAEISILTAIEKNKTNAKAINLLGEIYFKNEIKFFEAEQLFIQAINLEPKNIFYLISLGKLYFKQAKFLDAQKVFVTAANIMTINVVYELLGDTHAALSKDIDAWRNYAFAYDISPNKKLKAKLKNIQEKIPTQELSKQMILRSYGNFTRTPNFKTSYAAKVHSGLFSKKLLLNFSYNKEKEMVVDLPNLFVLSGITASIKKGNIEFYPKAIENKIQPEIINFIRKVTKIIDENFYEKFYQTQAQIKDGKMIYEIDGAKLILNSETALIEEFAQDGITVSIKSHNTFFIHKIPSKITIDISGEDIKINLNGANSFQILN
ncbi:MAG: tetratricopeptide repeat protein [Elusimicrobiota bacterium]|nr:tetratricopeptide repeat protein [Elusimicrobiota bacterium]